MLKPSEAEKGRRCRAAEENRSALNAMEQSSQQHLSPCFTMLGAPASLYAK